MNTSVLPTPMSSQTDDLRATVGAEALLALTLDAAQSLVVRPWAATKERPNPRMMLTLLTYSYACGVFSAADVEKASSTDETVRYICAREVIRASDVQRFRRGNRPWIEHCLAQVIAQVWLRTDARPAFRDAQGGAQHAVILAEAVRSARRRLSLAMVLDAEEGD
jgi:hypothetical protein